MARGSDARIEAIVVRAATVPTDAPESDGTLEWDRTTLVLCSASSGRETGHGWTYADPAAGRLAKEKLAPIVLGRDAFDVESSHVAMASSLRNLGRTGSSRRSRTGTSGRSGTSSNDRLRLGRAADGARVARRRDGARADRLLRGPTAQDRIVAFDCLSLDGMLVMLTLGLSYRSSTYLEAALMVALVAVLALVGAVAALLGSARSASSRSARSSSASTRRRPPPRWERGRSLSRRRCRRRSCGMESSRTRCSSPRSSPSRHP